MSKKAASKKAAGERESSSLLDNPRVQRARELAPMGILCGVAVLVLGGLALLPARTWMSQREAMDAAELELQRLEGEVAELDAQLTLLQTDAEVERQARGNYDLVYPGEESYRILPAPADD